jgi:hypothetical protein
MQGNFTEDGVCGGLGEANCQIEPALANTKPLKSPKAQSFQR